MQKGSAHVLVDVQPASVDALVCIRRGFSGSMRVATASAITMCMMVMMVMMVVMVVVVFVFEAAMAVRFMRIMMRAKLNVAVCAGVTAQCIIGEEIVAAGGICRGHCFCAVAVTFTIMRVAL
jgi:hypothetical protein